MEDRTPESMTDPEEPETLKNSLEGLYRLFEDAPLGCQSLDADGNVIMVNRAWLEILGYARDEVAGRPFSDFLAPGGAELFRQSFPLFKSKGTIRGMELDMVRKDGKTIMVSLEGTFARDRGGNIRLAHCILADITGRRRAEEEKTLLATMVNASPVSITVHDFDGRLLYFNERTLEMYGCSREEFLALDHDRCAAAGGTAHIAARLKEALEKGEILVEVRHPRKGQPDIPLLVYAKPVEWYGDKALLSMAIDITGRKKAESELLERNRALAALNSISVALASLEPGTDIREHIIKKYRELTGAVAAWFCDYVPGDRTLALKYLDIEPGKADRALEALGRNPGEVRCPVSEETYREITGTVVGRRATLAEVSFGMIPEDVGSAVQGLLGADRFIGIAHVIEGRLYGTSVLAMKSGTPDPPPELLEVSAHTVAVSLRRWLSENALRESEERFRKLFEAGPLGMAVSDMQYRFTDTNAMFCSILGYSADELGRLTFRDITHPEDIGRDVENIRRLDAGELPAYRTEKRYVRKDGRVVWGSVTVSLLHDSAGRAMHHLVMIEDITDRRRLEDSMRGSEQRYRSLVDNTTEGILLTAPDGRIFSANPPACRMLGRTEEEIIRLGRDGVVDRSDPRLEQGLETRARTGKFKGELTLVRSDGTKFPAEVSTAVFEQAGGERRTVMIISDISKRKSIEEALRASEEKFRRLFETSPEGVVLLDTEGAIIDVNDAGLELNCWTRDGVAGRPFQDLGGFTDDDKARFSDMLRRLNAGEQLDPLEMRVCVKGEERWMEIFMALLLKENEVHTIQVIMKDITERKRAHLEMRARLMKYKLEEGNIYMVTESAPVRSVEAFKDLLMAGYRGVMVTRTPHPDLSIGAAGQFEHLWLSEKGGPGSLGPRLENIGSWFENLPRNQAVLVDRLDYLISKNGCSRTLHFVHGLRELAYLRGHTIIISLDPATVGARLQRSLEKEALPIEPRSVPALPPDELEVLGHVFRQNLAAARSSFTELGRALGLSKPTARKKVRELVRRGYLTMSPRGRTKVLELTEQGRRIFSK